MEGERARIRAKLANPKFVDNAAGDVVQKQKDLLAENEAKAAKLQERLEEIAGRLLRSAARASTSLGGTVARAPQSPPAAFADWMRRELEYVT